MGGGANDGGVVGFLLCLDRGLSPLFVTFLQHLPDDVLFLALSEPGEVIGVAGVGCGFGCQMCFSSANMVSNIDKSDITLLVKFIIVIFKSIY